MKSQELDNGPPSIPKVAPKDLPEVCRDIPYMTTMEIAERTGIRHGDIMRLVRRELSAIDEDERKFASVYQGGNGEQRPCYCLPGEYLLHVLTAFDAKLRFALIKHWQAVNEGWAEPVKDVVNLATDRLVGLTRDQRHHRYHEEISKITARGEAPSAWDRFIASKP